jgi:hypothetical protein
LPLAVTPEGTVARGDEAASVQEPNESMYQASAEPAESHDALRADLSAFQPVSDPHSTAVSATSEHNT